MPPNTILTSFQMPSSNHCAHRRAGDGKVPGLSQGELNVSAVRWAKRDFDFRHDFVGSKSMGLQPAADPGVAGKKIGDRGCPLSTWRGYMNLSVQRGQRDSRIGRMIGEAKVATHDTAVVSAVTARQIAELAA